MFDKKLNYDKVHGELRSIYKRQLEIKKNHKYPAWSSVFYRTQMSPQERQIWINETCEFNDLSCMMTFLCCLLNHARGKVHLSKLTKKSGNYYPFKEYEVVDLVTQAKIINNIGKSLKINFDDYFLDEDVIIVAVA